MYTYAYILNTFNESTNMLQSEEILYETAVFCMNTNF